MNTEPKLTQRVAAKNVVKGHVAGWWLGGSGFVFKTHPGTIIYIDPYLSNSLKDILGLERGFASPIDPEDVRTDVVISTHWHEDHLDPGSTPIIARNNPEAKFCMPPSSIPRALAYGVSRSQMVALKWGETAQIRDVTVEAAPARHHSGIPGWDVSDPIGVLIKTDGPTIYHSGDTEYDVRLRRLKIRKPDVALLCINGVTGNMDAYEAALLAWHLGVGVALPIHHLLWAVTSGKEEETLDPELFAITYARLGGSGKTLLPQVGKEIDLIVAHPALLG